MTISKEKIIILLLCVTIVGLIVLRPSKEVLSDFHISKYKDLQKEKEKALDEVKQRDKEIINLIKKYEQVDSIYNDITKDELRERSNFIFRQHMLLERGDKVSIK